MTEKRNSYLVSKALKTFMFASILAALAGQLATTTDAIVVSHLIGPDAISAVNLVMPVLTLCTCLAFLFGVGGSVVAAKAMGRRDTVTANRVFTASIAATLFIGILLSLAGFFLSEDITGFICPVDSRIYPLALSFLRTIIVGISFSLVGFTLQTFVKTDGNPRLVSMAVISSSLLNFVFDIVFIQFFHMGIAGSAWATIVSYVVGMTVCLLHFRQPHHSLRLDWSLFFGDASVVKVLWSIVKEGFPMCINSLLLGLCIYGFNSIVLHALGADGMYIWSVCLQLFMITQMVLSGIGSSIFSIGGLLAGERDMPGLAILFRRVMTYVSSILLVVMAFVMMMPTAFGRLFGSSAIDVGTDLNTALIIFSLMLIPYAFVANLRVLYQIIGYRFMSVALSIAQLVVMVLFTWAIAMVSPKELWWGFPVSSVVLLAVVLLISWHKHRRQPATAPVTLIPDNTEGQVLNFSVRLTIDEAGRAQKDIVAFLKACSVDSTTQYNVRLCCEELLFNIVNHAVKKHPEKHFIDIHIRCTEPVITVLLKDDGRPFNPVLKETPEGLEHLGLKLVNACHTPTTITYKYMYSQNMVYMLFKRNQ